MPNTDRKDHWENVYHTKTQEQVSWFREHLETSIKLILETGVAKDAAIIDVGGGNSTLADDLLDLGFLDVSVLDISGKAINDSRERLGQRADDVNWIEADITAADLPPDRFNVWHDRAVFHFLTSPGDRHRYVAQVERSLRKGGHIIVASFGPEGPQKCSGLDVVRYSPESMHDQFGNTFKLVDHVEETHHTPFGTTQEFLYCYCRKV
jgi:ubiquinone/menaquinone biosynthesis C-methylase UbiE